MTWTIRTGRTHARSEAPEPASSPPAAGAPSATGSGARRGACRPRVVGVASLGIGFPGLAPTRSLAQFYVAMELRVGLGSAALGPVSGNTAVGRWFVKNRGTALGISTAGISMGGVVFVPLTQFFID